MAPDLRALRVAQTTSQLLQAKHLKKAPAWLQTVSRTPPSTNFARTPAPAFQAQPKIKGGRPRLFQPQRIEYREDTLRRRFYNEHPWELARPVKVLETDGQDAKRFDWRILRQPGRTLTGENVVQRQLYLMTAEKKTRDEAYDIARQEFYRERMSEQVERTIAMEEALAFGATFDKSEMRIGLELEDKVLVDWKEKATAAKQLIDPLTIVSPEEQAQTQAETQPDVGDAEGDAALRAYGL